MCLLVRSSLRFPVCYLPTCAPPLWSGCAVCGLVSFGCMSQATSTQLHTQTASPPIPSAHTTATSLLDPVDLLPTRQPNCILHLFGGSHGCLSLRMITKT
ncbi:hypothetical protein IWX50DRAFT_498020 [Phyllosticta citricarpa]